MSNVTSPSPPDGVNAGSASAFKAELAALRARAYGPDADIHDDPDALRRLTALEDEARGAADSASAISASVGIDVPRPAQLAEPQHPIAPAANWEASVPEIAPNAAASDEEQDPAGPASTPASRWAWMLRPSVWIASLALTAAITGVVTTMIVTHDPTVVARLQEIPREEWPEAVEQFGLSAQQVFEEYNGLTAVVGAGSEPGQPIVMCLYLFAGHVFATGSCQGEAIEPRVDFIAGAEYGARVGEAFADGTAVRITLEGDTVVVRAVEGPQEVAER